jgi:hypothetical protein
MHIYVSLLKQMAPEHLLATSSKLCAEIFAVVCDGLLSVDDAGGRDFRWGSISLDPRWFPVIMN